MQTNNFMPHRCPRIDFPVSRDWEDIDCASAICINNSNSKCSVPSLAKIGEDGRCKGFKTKDSKDQKRL